MTLSIKQAIVATADRMETLGPSCYVKGSYGYVGECGCVAGHLAEVLGLVLTNANGRVSRSGSVAKVSKVGRYLDAKVAERYDANVFVRYDENGSRAEYTQNDLFGLNDWLGYEETVSFLRSVQDDAPDTPAL